MASDVKQDTAPTAEADTVDGEVVEPGTDLEKIADDHEPDIFDGDAWDAGDEDWPYEFVEYRGDRLAVRKPTDQGLAAFSLGSSKFIKPDKQNNLVGLFIERHLSPASYDRMMGRMMDPDDTEYGPKSIGQVMGLVVGLRTRKQADDDKNRDTDS